MITRRKKRCKGCLTMQYIWAYGRCQYCDMKHHAERDGDDTLIGRDSKENHPEAEELIQKAKRIKHFSNKRQQVELALKKAKLEKFEGWDGCCEGCGTSGDYIDCSHRLSRKDYPHLIADINNLDWYCRERCHPNVESLNFEDLNNGEEVAKYVFDNAYQNTSEKSKAFHFLEALARKAG
jgi:hypothetical protein